MDGLITDILAIVLLVFLFWNDNLNEVDNWDKLNIIIHKSYIEAYQK